MLKIWLTWLQPRLGLFGAVLILCNPLYTYAAPKSVTISNSKLSTQPSRSTVAVRTGTTIEQELLSAIAPPPDFAVRQLAIDSMTTGSFQAKSATSTILQSKQKALTRLASPATRSQKLSARAKPQQLKYSTAKALARAIYPQITIPVTGLVIGNTDIRTSKQFSPNLKPLARSMSSAVEIGAPTSLSAMMAATPTVSPFPVVRPELMEKLAKTPAVAKIATIKTTPYALNPIAEIPTGRIKAVTPKTIGLKATAFHSLDPIAAIPSGLQRLLGNNLNSQPKVAVKPIVTNTSSLVALKSFVAPTSAITPTLSGASLQLATAQAYTSVPKFEIPGEKLLAVKPAVNLQVVKPAQKSLLTMVMGRKSNYVALMNDRQLTPATKQSWNLVTQRNNLGGLILGSQALATVSNSKIIGLLPTTMPTNSNSVGFPMRNLANFN
jgi:hypothetical protein